MPKLTRVLFAFALFLAPRVLATEITGRVAGYVYDPTGAALSEVPLTVSGSHLQQAVSRTTGDDGRYEFDNLPPGEDYVIEVNVPGFTPIKETNIKVRLGQTTTSDIHLNVLTETQAVATYQIVEKVNPVLNPDSAQQVAVINSEKAAQTPIFHQVEGMAQQVAGVGPGTRPATRGGLARYGKFLVDGMDTTDVTDGSITAPMNFDAVENFEIITGAMDAQYNSMGMITNVVTKNGSNEFKLDTSVTLGPTWMTAKNKFPASSPQLFTSYLNNPAPAAETSFYSPVVNFGGPLIKDKLWFYASYQQNFSSRGNPISLFGIQSNRDTVTTTSLGRVKFTYQATPNDRIGLGFNLNRNVINNLSGSSFVTQAGESKIHRGGEFIIANVDHNFSDTTLFQLQTGMTFKQSNTDPIYSDFQTVSHRDLTSGITDFNSGSLSADQQGNFQHETKWRFQFDPSLSWKVRAAGTHQMKAGLQYSWLIDQQTAGVSGDQRFIDRGGVCDPSNPTTFGFCFQRIDYRGNTGIDANGNPTSSNLFTRAYASVFGAFIQDRWNVSRQLTVIPGFRVDIGKLYGDVKSNSGSNLLTNLVGVGPRLSATYDLFGDRKSIVSGHYGRSNDVGNIFIAQHGNPAITQYISNFTTGPTGAKAFPDCVSNVSQTGCQLAGGATGRFIAPHQAPPHVDELALSFHQEVVQETVLGVDLNYRRYANMWVDKEINRVWDASGQRVVGYANGQNQQIISAATPSSAYRDYEGMDLSVQGTPGRWDLLASYTLAFNHGTVADYFDGYLTNPRQAMFYDGYTPDDRRHTLKGSIAYRTSFGLDLGFRLQYRTGAALWERTTNPADGSAYFRSPRGSGFPINSNTNASDFNDPNSWSDIRQPDTFIFDAQLRQNLGDLLHIKQRLEAVLLVVNALNNAEASSLTDSFTRGAFNRFGYATFHNSPMQAEVLIRFRN